MRDFTDCRIGKKDLWQEVYAKLDHFAGVHEMPQKRGIWGQKVCAAVFREISQNVFSQKVGGSLWQQEVICR